MNREDVFEKVYKIAVIVTGDQPSAYEIAKQVSQELAIEGVGEEKEQSSKVGKCSHCGAKIFLVCKTCLGDQGLPNVAQGPATPIGGEKEAKKEACLPCQYCKTPVKISDIVIMCDECVSKYNEKRG